MKLQFSIIIPVYNRPQEVDELLNSLTEQDFTEDFEIIVVEDGSEIKADKIVDSYKDKLNLKYFFKQNSGAGESRNFGMKNASGNYFIIFDSDCLIPSHYLTEVHKTLSENYTDAYGGADAAHESFTKIQKAINFSMTSFFTTGGIRGNKNSVNKFQPRSFNFGISKKAFEKVQGFSNMKIGEDIDLTFRLWKHHFETQFIENAYVFHKRRTTLKQFFKQTFSFGKARPLLNKKYPETAKITYWFPTLFISSLGLALLLLFIHVNYFALIFGVYFLILFLSSAVINKSLTVAILSLLTTIIQFFGYGLGFVKGLLSVNFGFNGKISMK